MIWNALRADYQPDALRLVVPILLEWIHLMERGMLQGIQSRAE